MLKKEQLHDYQVKAVDMIVNNFNCGLFLDCGLGKTVSTLTAIQELREIGFIDKVLIIAPKKLRR